VAEVLAFDLYGTLVDPAAISTDLDHVPGIADGAEVARLWRLKQLEYSFRLTVMGRYRDFQQVTACALDFALASAGVRLTDRQLQRLVECYDHLPVFPDTEAALRSLADLGCELAVLSNGTPSMIQNCLANCGLGGYFTRWLSADAVGAFKPSPLVYRYAAERLGRPLGQIRLVTSNPFDSVGAGAAGMPTAWVNRSSAPFDTIGPPPDITVPALSQLPEVLAR
jgi:2-haloacid dehalogenase